MSDSNDEEVSEVSEEFKHLFQGSRFRFEGLSAEVEEDFVKVVKEMGAEVSKKAKITFVQSSYFEKHKSGGRKDFYNINYIADSVEAGTALDLKNYIFVPDVDLDDEPFCYAARYMYRTDSCEKCYYSKVFCKECTKESRLEESLRAANQDRNHIISESDTSLEDEIMNSPDQEALGQSSKSSKRIISSDSEQDSSDEEQSKSNCAKRSPVRKKLKSSSDVDATSNREESPEIDVENYSDSDSSQSNDEPVNNSQNGQVKPVNNSQNGQVEEATKGISGSAHNVIEQKNLTPRTNGVVETTDNISLPDDPSDSELNTGNNKKSLQKVKAASSSGWINSSKPKIPVIPVKTEPPALPKPEPLSNDLLNITDDDEERYFTGEEWWKPRYIPENERCTVLSCSYEPTPHPIHYPFRKFLSAVEKKILVKYLIIKNAIHAAKGQSVYETMIKEGYLTHRSWETLRSCLRRTIIKEIHSYKLKEDILNQFLVLGLKSNTKIKEET